ncbi:hypothetical protein [Neobacillus sp. LXY-1]|uniref:hypothetical protein n=1 Tax=Neobacillus sp. LXY-1 TaxID=3379133 RepID=UPI003EE07DA5
MKKTLIGAGLGFVLVLGGWYAFNSYKEDKTVTVKTTKHVAAKTVHKVSGPELDTAAKNFYEIEANLKGDDIFYYGMITMALQKLEFKDEENYRLLNTPENIQRIQLSRANLQYLKNKVVELKASEPYPNILDKWLKGDFSHIEKDYLTIRNLKNDPTQPSENPVLKVRTTEEEEKYIQHFFGDEGLQKNKIDWEL